MSRYKWIPEGVIPFCRSMGAPLIEEYMFSYSWRREEIAVRTLAKAVWNAGAGVWIDVIKLYFYFCLRFYLSLELPAMK